jgi:membrane-associated phospholipid phosphatase
MSSNRLIIRAAKVISSIFSPFYFSFWIFLFLLFFSYLRFTPWILRLYVLAMVYVMTIAAPRFGIYLYCKINGWTHHNISERERRFVPYIISILCYGVLLYVMYVMRMPEYTLRIISCGLIVQILCAICNLFIKVSSHAAASGAAVGILIAFSFHFFFNPTIVIAIAILINGLVCTSRLVLLQHKLLDTTLGSLVGLACGFLSIVLF